VTRLDTTRVPSSIRARLNASVSTPAPTSMLPDFSAAATFAPVPSRGRSPNVTPSSAK
jgi:hypothetical protein